MKTKSPLLRIDRLLITVLAIIAAPHAHSQTTYTFTNQTSGSTWLTTNNWQTNGVASTSRPDTNSIARFTNSTTTSVGLNLNTSNSINSGSLLMGGTGTLTLSNSSTAASGQLILYGTGAETNLIVSTNTGTLVLTNGASRAMDLQLGTSGTINVSNSSGNVTIFSLIKQDAGETNGFTKTGAGTLTIGGTNSNTYSGLTMLSDGSLRFNKTAGQNVSAGDILINGGNLVLQNSNQMSDTTALTNAGGTNNFGGFTDTIGSYVQTSGLFTNGTLTATNYGLQGGTIAGNLGTGTINASASTALNGTAAATTVNVTGGTLTLGSASRLTGTTPTVNISGGSTLALGGSESVGTLNLTNGTLSGSGTFTASNYNVMSGTISAALGTGTLTKSTAGTVTLSGVSASNGTVAITAGLLNVTANNTNRTVTVSSTGILGGTAGVGATTITNGGRIAPGNAGVGTLSVSSLTLEGGGGYNWELTSVGGSAGSGWDLINVGSTAGTVTVNSTSGSPFTIYVNGTWATSGFSGSSSYSWTIIDAATLTGFSADKFALDTTSFTGGTATGTWGFANTSGDLVLSYTARVLSSVYGWNAGSGAWSTAGNWTNNSAPTNGSSLLFTGAAGTATNNATLTSVSGVNFSNTTGSIVLAGDAFSVGLEGIKNESGNSHTISNNLSLTNAISINASSNAITIAGNITNDVVGQTITVAGGANTVVDGVISGQGKVTKTGAGSLTLGANNTFTGALAANEGTTLLNGTVATTTVNVGGGTLLFGAADRLADGATLTLSSGTLNLGGFTDTLTTYTQSGGLFTNGTLTATTYGLSGGTVAGNLGAGTINVTGSTALNGAAGAGTLNINSGTLTLGSASRLTGTMPAVAISNGATLALGGAESVGSIAGGGGITLGSATLTAGSANTSTTFSGAISGTGGLTKAGNGTLTLTGANTYSGTTTVSAGQLSVSNNSSSDVSISAGAVFAMNAAQTLSNLSGSGTLSMGTNALTFSAASGSSTFGGAITGTGAFTKSGAASLTLSGANTFTGAISLNAGLLSVSADGNLGNAANDLTLGGGTLATTASFAMDAGRDLSGTGTLDVAAGTTLTNSGTVNMTSLTLANTGAFVMAGSAKTNNALTFSAGGVLSNTGTAAVIGGNVTANNTSGTAVMAGAYNLGSASRTFTVSDGSASVDMQLLGDLTLSGSSAFLIKAGTGRLEINGVNTALSGLQIGVTNTAAAGQVLIGNKNAVGTNTLRINSGTLEASTALTGANAITNSMSFGGRGATAVIIGGTNAIEFSGGLGWFGFASTASTLQVDNEAIFSGVISNGTAGSTLEFSGAGSLTFSGSSANLFTNLLTISNTGLTVIAAKNDAFGTTAAGTTVQSGSTIILSNVTYSTTEALTISGTGVGGNGALRGAGTSSFAGTVTAGGATTIAADSGAALTLSGNVNGGGNAVTFAGTGNSTVSGIISNGTLVKGGAGTLTLSGANTYTGGTLVSGGALLGDTRSLQKAITNNSAIVFSQSTNGTFGSVISGGGTLTKSGSGTVTLTNNNTYSGATVVSAGRLVVNGSQSSSAVTVNNGASLGGTGTVGGLTVSGLLAPGNSIGTINAGSTTLNGGGSFQLEIFDWVNTPGTGWDLLAVTGDLALSNTSLSPFTINLVSLVNNSTTGLSTDWNQNLSFTNTFITYSGSLLGNSFASDLFSVNTSGFQNPVNGTFSITNVTGGLALLYTTAFIPASDYTWSAGSGVWSSSGNWTNSGTPKNGDSIIFAGSGGTSENDAVVSSILGLTFSNTAGSYNVSGTTLAIGAGGIANQSTAAQTISNNLSLSSAATVTASNGDLVFAGNITNGSNSVTFTGAKNTTVSGVISGTSSLAKDGAGTLTLTGANSYAGGTTVSAGRLVGDSTSLQGAIADNAAVTFNQVTNGTYAGILSGTGSLTKQGAGTLLLSASNSYSGGSTIDAGTLQINGANRLGATAGALTINNGELQLTTTSLSSGRNIVLGHANSAIEVDAGLRYTATNNSVISGSGTLNKFGAGTLALYGTNTYSGGNVIAAGTLEGDTTSLQGAISNNGAVSFLQATNGTYGSAISGTGSLTKTGNGTLTLAGENSYSGGTLLSAGTLSGNTASLQGAITNNATIVMSQTTNGTYSGAMSGAGAFTKSGSGTITLGGNNSSYNGTIDLQAGGLIAGHNNALGSGAFTLTNGSVQAANGVNIANNFTIGSGGGFSSNSFTAYWNFGTNSGTSNTTTSSGTGITFGAVSQGNNNGTTTLLTTTTASSGYTGASGNYNAGAAARTGALSTGANGSAYFEFSLTADSGYTLSLTNFTFGSRGTGTAPTLATLLSSIDSYASALSTNALAANSSWALYSPNLVASMLTNGVVTFRIYGSAGTGSPGANTANWRIDDLNLYGYTVSGTPAAGSGTLGIAQAGSATFSGNVLNNNQATLTAAAGGSATFSGVISGAGSATKTGAGTVTLSGTSANTFTGTTTLTEGVLELNKTAGVNAIASTNITVSKLDSNNRATLLLSANNQVANTTTVTLSGGTITRASGVSEVFGNLNLTEASFLDFGSGEAGTIGFGTYAPSALTALNIVNFTQGNTLTFRSDLTDSITTSAFAFSGAGGLGSYAWDQGATTFTITAIPEPSTYLAAAGLLGLMLWPSRKRIIRDARKVLGLRAPMRDRLARARQ